MHWGSKIIQIFALLLILIMKVRKIEEKTFLEWCLRAKKDVSPLSSQKDNMADSCQSSWVLFRTHWKTQARPEHCHLQAQVEHHCLQAYKTENYIRVYKLKKMTSDANDKLKEDMGIKVKSNFRTNWPEKDTGIYWHKWPWKTTTFTSPGHEGHWTLQAQRVHWHLQAGKEHTRSRQIVKSLPKLQWC